MGDKRDIKADYSEWVIGYVCLCKGLSSNKTVIMQWCVMKQNGGQFEKKKQLDRYRLLVKSNNSHCIIQPKLSLVGLELDFRQVYFSSGTKYFFIEICCTPL